MIGKNVAYLYTHWRIVQSQTIRRTIRLPKRKLFKAPQYLINTLYFFQVSYLLIVQLNSSHDLIEVCIRYILSLQALQADIKRVAIGQVQGRIIDLFAIVTSLSFNIDNSVLPKSVQNYELIPNFLIRLIIVYIIFISCSL